MLRVFDAKAAIARAVLLRYLGEDVEQFRVGPVADRVDGDVEAGPVRGHDVLLEFRQRRVEDAGVVPFVQVWLEHSRRARTEATIDEALHSADLDPVAALPRLEAELRQFFPRGQRPAQV